jgi:hypothetical protein
MAVKFKLIPLLMLSLLAASTIYLVQANKQTREVEEAEAATSGLFIRTNKSLVYPGESYTIQVWKDIKTHEPYSGYLEVGDNCNSGGTSCTSKGVWKGFDGNEVYVNASTTVNIPAGTSPFSVSVRFRPHPNPQNFGWSNLIEMGVGTTQILKNTANYYVFWTGEKKFIGTNRVYDNYQDANGNFPNKGNANFNTWVSFPVTLADVCQSGPGRIMRFRKSQELAYWNPAIPWLNQIWSGTPNWQMNPVNFDGRFKRNLDWYLVDWKKDSGWLDTYLSSWGGNVFNMSSGVKEAQYRMASADTKFPGYFLTPQWVGSGWGLGNSQALAVVSGPLSSLCQTPYPTTTHLWTVHADILTLTTPTFSGPALRLKYYEGLPDFMSPQTTSNFLREDWWFIEGQGLVRIEVKHFGNYSGFESYISPCIYDADCQVNNIMTNPNVVLTREDFMPVPTNTPTPKPTSTPTPVPTNTPTPKPTSTPTPVPTNTATPTPTIYTDPVPTSPDSDRPPKATSTPTETPIDLSPKPGDANEDGKVDGLDYVIWLNNYGKTTTQKHKAGDFDGNGKVDGLDYVIWLNNYGK